MEILLHLKFQQGRNLEHFFFLISITCPASENQWEGIYVWNRPQEVATLLFCSVEFLALTTAAAAWSKFIANDVVAARLLVALGVLK